MPLLTSKSTLGEIVLTVSSTGMVKIGTLICVRGKNATWGLGNVQLDPRFSIFISELGMVGTIIKR